MATIVILTGNHLCHNPRAMKEAHTLATAGFDVEVLGAWLDAERKAHDLDLLKTVSFRFTPVLDITTQKMSWFYCRCRVKGAQLWHQCTGRESAWQLGYTTGALLRAARQRKADLFIAHSEPALWAVAQLQNRKTEIGNRQFQIGVDMEDWFSEDLLPEARRQRPVDLLKNLERQVLSATVHATCTSQAMSAALAEEYGCPPPTVIYNAFPWADRQKLDGQFKDRRDCMVPSLHWYSQTLGAGRGLEDLLAALPRVKHPLEIHLRGNLPTGNKTWLWSRVPENWRKWVFVHDLVSNDELLSRIAEHDIGFAGEQKYCLNKELTVSNKMLHYLLGGLAVVASDTAGQREVAEQAGGAVRLYSAGDSQALAQKIGEFLDSSDTLPQAKFAALRSAEIKFSWEKSAPYLVDAVKAAIRPRNE